MKKYNIRMPVEVDPSEIVTLMDRGEALDFIAEIDLSLADIDFTENLIIRLLDSLKGDVSEEEWKTYETFKKFLENQA